MIVLQVDRPLAPVRAPVLTLALAQGQDLDLAQSPLLALAVVQLPPGVLVRPAP